jgi:hypothetical protein
MEQIIKKIQKLREWEFLGLITTTGHTSGKGLNEFLSGLENDTLKLKESESAKQRALLVAFAEWHSSTYYEEITMEEDVDEFLNTLKHSTK